MVLLVPSGLKPEPGCTLGMGPVKLSLTGQEMGAQLQRTGAFEPSTALVMRTEGASQASRF